MNKNLQIIFLSFFFILMSSIVYSKNITIILLRHAEKDTSATANKKNPDLSDAGSKRARLLVETIGKYEPKEIFSTIFNRTRMTVTPLAVDLYDAYRLQIQIYDSSEQDTFAKKLLDSTSKCLVVVGHSNTIPALANILIREQKYKDLADSEYNKIWIVKIKTRGKKPYKIREVKLIEY
jgi:2,3-bisphosphoglycerate-dependent phosphoglycerate mutase